MMPLGAFLRGLLARLSTAPAPGERWVWVGDAAMPVSADRALTVSAVFACVRYIGESIGALPWHVFERRGANRVARQDDPLDWLIGTRPNSETSAMAWREKLLADAMLAGGGYAEIERDQAGRPIALWQLDGHDTEPKRADDGSLVYLVRGAGSRVPVPADRILHLHGLGTDGLTGLSVIACGARDVGVALAQSTYAGAVFRNGNRPSLLVETEQALKKEQIDLYREQIERIHGGPANAGKAAVLGNGLKAKPLSLSPADMQLIEATKATSADIARWFRVPPHKIGLLDRATWGNIEHQAIEAVTDCLLPWCVRLEQEVHAKLIGRNNQARVYTKLNLAALLRGDVKSRFEAYATGRQNGWLSANDIRDLEDQNPIPGGDEYLVQSNMVPLSLLRRQVEAQIERDRTPRPDPAPDPVDPAAWSAHRILNLGDAP